MSIEGQGHFFTYIFQVLYVLCFTRPRYQVSVYRTTGPLVMFMIKKKSHQGVACPLTGVIYVYDHYIQTSPRKRHTIKRRFMIILRSPEPNKLDMNIVNIQYARKRSALICSLNPVTPDFFFSIFIFPFRRAISLLHLQQLCTCLLNYRYPL